MQLEVLGDTTEESRGSPVWEKLFGIMFVYIKSQRLSYNTVEIL